MDGVNRRYIGIEEALDGAIRNGPGSDPTNADGYRRENFHRVSNREDFPGITRNPDWWRNRTYLGYRADGSTFVSLHFSFAAELGWRMNSVRFCD